MACTELLVHGFDIAAAALTPFSPPDDGLARAVVERVLPWAPPGRHRLITASPGNRSSFARRAATTGLRLVVAIRVAHGRGVVGHVDLMHRPNGGTDHRNVYRSGR